MELIKNMPDDVIYEIMSFSHSEITFKYSMVLRQILYYANDYTRINVSFVTYMLARCDKMSLRA
jgi:hypothetical protein